MPTKVVYDFHHNVRDISWGDFQTEGATAGSPGFHPLVLVEAGGHRHLWGIGEVNTNPAGYSGGYVKGENINLDPIIDIMIAYLRAGNVIPFTLKGGATTLCLFDITNVGIAGMDSLKDKIISSGAKGYTVSVEKVVHLVPDGPRRTGARA